MDPDLINLVIPVTPNVYIFNDVIIYASSRIFTNGNGGSEISLNLHITEGCTGITKFIRSGSTIVNRAVAVGIIKHNLVHFNFWNTPCNFRLFSIIILVIGNA